MLGTCSVVWNLSPVEIWEWFVVDFSGPKIPPLFSASLPIPTAALRSPNLLAIYAVSTGHDWESCRAS